MSQDEFSKLHDLIGDFKNDVASRFDEVDKRFEAVEERFDSQFMKLYNYVGEFRADVNERFKEVDEKFDGVNSRLDDQAGMITDNHIELAALGAKTDRVEKNTQELACILGHKLAE